MRHFKQIEYTRNQISWESLKREGEAVGYDFGSVPDLGSEDFETWLKGSKKGITQHCQSLFGTLSKAMSYQHRLLALSNSVGEVLLLIPSLISKKVCLTV